MKRFVPQGFREKGGLLCGYFCFAWLLNPSVPLLEFENEIARLGGILSLFTRQCREMQTIGRNKNRTFKFRQQQRA